MRRPLPPLLCALACTSLVAAHDQAPNSFQTVDVAPGVIAFISPGTTSGVINGNSVAIIGDDGVLVVDAGQFPLTTRRMIDELRKRTDKPVRFLVNTHWHADHVLADQEYRRAFPGVALLAHDETRRLMMKNKERVLQLPTDGPGLFQALQAAQARGTRRDGTPFSDDDKRQIQDQVRDLGSVQAELPETRFVLPDLTFSGSASVYLGNREVRLLHLGRGNTAGDVMVQVPDAGVLVAGDVVVAPIPFGFGSYPTEWLGVLDKVLALDATAIVPGHGPVMRDTSYVRTLQSLLASLRSQVQAAAREGLTLEQTRKRLDLDRIRAELTRGDPLLEKAFGQFFLDSAVGQAYKEARSEELVE